MENKNISNTVENISKNNLELEEKITKKSLSFSEKIADFFNKIEFLDLSWEQKAEVATKVKQNSTPDKLFWMEIFLSWVIATLWLLQNSVAVVIWAMLIAPFLRPMNGIWFAIARGEKKFFYTPAKVLFLSVILSIFIWYIITKIVWLDLETKEILARTSPNIIDLFIAIFSAIVAVLSLWYSRLSESIAWVAMAAALMPPLSVVWIELAFWNYDLAFGALMLFVANLVSIVLVATIFFWLYWFTPHDDSKQKSTFKRFIFLVITIFVISIPLIHSLVVIKRKIDIKHSTISYLQNVLKEKTNNFIIDKLEVLSLKKDKIKLKAVIKIPENIDFYESFKKQLDFELSKKFNREVELEVELIRIANIVSKDEKVNIKSKIYDFINKYFSSNYKNYHIISLDILWNNKKSFNIKIIFWIKNNSFNLSDFKSLEESFSKYFWVKANFSYIPVIEYSSQNLTKNQKIINQKIDKIKNKILDFIEKNKPENMSIENINVNYDILKNKFFVNIRFLISLNDLKKLDIFMKKLNDFVKNDKTIILNSKVFFYKEYNFDLNNKINSKIINDKK